MQNIVFGDLASFLSFELDEPAVTVRQVLREAPSRIPLLLEKLQLSELFLWKPVVAEPIYLGGPKKGAALVEANVELQPSYVARLVERQGKSADHAVGPISVGLTKGVLAYYREKITKKLEVLVADARRSMGGGLEGVHRLLETSPELQCVQKYFDEVVISLLNNRDMLQAVVLVLSDGGDAPVLKKSLNAALVAMAVLSLYPQLGPVESRRRQLTELGTAAVFQDISLLTRDGGVSDGHCERSAQIASGHGVTPGVADLIRLHHSVKTSAGRPILEIPDALGEPARVLVVVNVYLGMIEENDAGTALEFMKRLSYLAKGKYLDNVAVEVLYKICLPSVKASVLEGAEKIGRSCARHAAAGVPWPVAGDRVPSVFICEDDECPDAASQTVSLAQNLPFVVDGKVVTTISKGDYRVCSLLSAKLRSLHTAVQAQFSR